MLDSSPPWAISFQRARREETVELLLNEEKKDFSFELVFLRLDSLSFPSTSSPIPYLPLSPMYSTANLLLPADLSRTNASILSPPSPPPPPPSSLFPQLKPHSSRKT